jgi:endogenous inhibitor of DNA gyrase (YacG/DUF329 family)
MTKILHCPICKKEVALDSPEVPFRSTPAASSKPLHQPFFIL